MFAGKAFKKGDFLSEYKGDLINEKEAARREEQYAKEMQGCYMFYFRQNGKLMW